jgi:hypothetical protein
VLIGLSPFSLWWSICTYFISVQGAIVLMYYFLHTERRGVRALCALGVGEAGAMYVCALYPAWQVPFGYIALALIVWLAIDSWKQIRALRLLDWAMVGGAVAFLGSVVVAYLSDSAEYMQAITETVYPGERFSAGGNAFRWLFPFLQAPLYPFESMENPSEASALFSLFPLPMLFALWTLGGQLWRRRTDKTQKVDALLACLLVPALFLTLYCTTGIPSLLASLSMMSYSLPERAAPFLALLQIYLLLRLFSLPKEQRLPSRVGVSLSALCVVASAYFCRLHYGAYMPVWYLLAAAIGTVLFGTVVLCHTKEWLKKATVLALCAVLTVSGLCVLPITRGTDALTEKPISHAISDLVAADPTAKWCGYGNNFAGQYLIANGAPSVTSVNYIPNMALWQTLDPTGQYNEVYNRYAHITCTFTAEATSFELLGPDHMHLRLSYSDLAKTDVRYVFSMAPLEAEESDAVDFRLLYCEQNALIYEVIYL